MPRSSLKQVLGPTLAAVLLGISACSVHRAETPGFSEAPRRLWSPPLTYPESLMLARIQGSVLLQARVDATGRIDRSSVRVLRSSNRGFEAPAIEMLTATRFRPAYVGDVPTAAVIEVPVRFELGRLVEDSAAAAAAAVEGERLASAGDIGRAMDAFTEAQRLDTRLGSSPTIPGALCWYGSLWGYAEEVMGMCERVVRLVPDDVRARDARGIARALTGDLAGAMDDFQAVIAASANERQRAERANWIRALRDGRNPVTPAVVERLRGLRP